MYGQRADRGKGQRKLVGRDPDHGGHLHRVPDLMAKLDPRSLHGLGGVRESLPEHMHGHHLVGDIGRGEEGSHRVAMGQSIQQADGIDTVFIRGGVTRICARIIYIPCAAEIVEI